MQASKAAMFQFFETLRIEFGPDIKITIVTPGFIESELTQGKHLDKDGQVDVNTDVWDVSFPADPPTAHSTIIVCCVVFIYI